MDNQALSLETDMVNYNKVKDLVVSRLIEEGYSRGPHESEEMFHKGLEKYNLPMPVYNSKKVIFE